MFDLSHDHKLSLKMGALVPVLTIEALPGDKFHMSSEAMFRLMPLVSPMMHKVDVYLHFFFVPNRILWDGWERFIMGPEDGNPSAPIPAFPTLDYSNQSYNVQASSLMDYMGLPVGTINGGTTQPISAMPFAAYQRIYHEYYRDQNLQTTVGQIDLIDGEQTVVQSNNLVNLQYRAWEHDYFTSCLPFAQKGAAVELPLDLSSVNVLSHDAMGTGGASFTPNMRVAGSGVLFGNANLGTDGGGNVVDIPSGGLLAYDPAGDLYLDGGTTTTINDLRTAMSLQKWLELNARAGSRYVEGLLAHFGVRSSDKRLQRPEYLGGSRSQMAISEVLQTSETASSPQGNMAGHGISVNGGRDFSYYCEEHGFVIGILSVRPKTAYYQGIPKHFLKFRDRLEYYWPAFAELGEEEVKNVELYYSDAAVNQNDETFGYLPRYTEYRFLNGRVSGQMKTSLEFWHMGRKFSALPGLNSSFITCDPTLRVFANNDPADDTIVAHIYHRIMARRPLPQYGSPGSL